MISAKKWWIPKLYNSSRSTTFSLIISLSDKVIVNIVHKSTCLLYSLWNYEWHVDWWTMFSNTLLNEEMIKIKVVDLDELYNFGIHHFFIWNHLMVENLVRTCYFFKFENLNCSNFVKWKEWPNQHSNLIGHDFRKF